MRLKDRLFSWGQSLSNPAHLIAFASGLIPFLYLLSFIQEHALNLPRYDSATRSVPFAIAARLGTFTVQDLFYSKSGHITVPSMAVTAVMARVNAWNLNAEMGVILVIAVVTFCLLLWLAWYTEPKALPWMVFPAAMMFFSIQQNVTWLTGYTGIAWFGTQLWVLLALLAAWFAHNRWWGNPLAFALALLATFAIGSGVIVWGLLLFVLIARGTRNPWTYVAWTGAAAGSFVLYLSIAGVEFGSDPTGDGSSITGMPSIGDMLTFVLAYLGNMFSSREILPARRVGGYAMLLAIANLAVLTIADRDWRFVKIWVPVAGYSVLTAALAAVARAGPEGLPVQGWYITSTGFFWIALLFSSVLVVTRLSEKPSWWRGAIALTNLGAWVIWGTMFVPSNQQSLARQLEQGRFLNETCHVRFLYRQRDDIPGCSIWYPEATNILSYYDMSMFATHERQNILQNRHEPGTPIVLESIDGWGTYNIQKWLLDGVPATDVHHVTPTLPQSTMVHTAIDIGPAFQDVDALADAVGSVDSLHYIRLANTDSAVEAYWERLRNDTFTETTYTVELPEGSVLAITRYERLTDPDDRYRFGEDIRLVGTQIPAVALTACETALVKSFWRGDAPTSIPYSVTYTLLNTNGEAVARSDGQLSYVPSNEWDPERVYLDERELILPCELPAGDYPLTIGVYDWRDGQRLPVYELNRPTDTDLLQVGMLQVED